MVQKYGKSSKVLLATKGIPNLHFIVNGESELPEHLQNSLNPVGEVMEVMEMNVCPENAHELFTSNLQSSDSREQSGNLLKNIVKKRLKGREVGVALEDSMRETTLQSYGNQQLKVDGTLKQLNNLLCGSAGVELQATERCGDSHKLSQNSIEIKDGSWLQTKQTSYDDGESEQDPGQNSECGKYSPVSHPGITAKENDTSVGQTQESQPCTANRRAIGGGDSSESSQELSKCTGNNVSVPGVSWFKKKKVSKLVGLTAAWQPSKVEGCSMGANTVNFPKANSTSVHTEFNFFL